MLKHRLILDCRVSGTNDMTTKRERIVLPKLWDVVGDAVHLYSCCEPGESVSFFVCDFRDAFYMLPVLARERRCFCTAFGGCIYVWARVAQGSVNGPNVFGRLSALTARMTQALVSPDEARLQQYIDDPCTTMRGY